MPTTVLVPDFALVLQGASDNGTTLSWTSVNNATATSASVVDNNDDGNIDSTGSPDFFDGGVNFNYSGYTVTIGGNVYAVFRNPLDSTEFAIPYDSTFDDLNGQLTGSGSTTDKTENTVPQNFQCFVTGTQIATPLGQRAVEDLKIGDEVTTADGRAVAVKWVGRQPVRNILNGPWENAKLVPVCIKAGALGAFPDQDLYVSADHGIILDGQVINAGALANDDTIRLVDSTEMPPEFIYWHIETDAHDVILANSTPAETFMDAAGRAMFENHAEYVDLYGAERIIPEMRLPRITAARLLPEGLKAQLGITDEDESLIA